MLVAVHSASAVAAECVFSSSPLVLLIHRSPVDSRWYTFKFIPDAVTNCKVLPAQKQPAEFLQPQVAQVSVSFSRLESTDFIWISSNGVVSRTLFGYI